jgi:hypothetical protein
MDPNTSVIPPNISILKSSIKMLRIVRMNKRTTFSFIYTAHQRYNFIYTSVYRHKKMKAKGWKKILWGKITKRKLK